MFCRSQYSHSKSRVMFILYRWLLRLLWPIKAFIIILISLVDSLRKEFFGAARLELYFLRQIFIG